jgi:hypothetical protein
MSIIYQNIRMYRTVMQILYRGKYRQRFSDITTLLDTTDTTIIELCFGDIYIAEYCRKTAKQWSGFDMNRSFVSHAKRKGFSAFTTDLSKLAPLPSADVGIIAGSLYHFHPIINPFLSLLLASAGKVIISEPILNLTCRKGLFGAIAARLSDAGKGKEPFRYTRSTMVEMLDNQAGALHFHYEIISEAKDLLIRITRENH